VFASAIKNTLEDKTLEIVVNNKAQSVHYKGQVIDLTPTEFRLLSYFLVHRGEAISKKELERTLWGEEDVSRNLIYTHIGNLKKKIPSVGDLVQVKKGSLFVEET
ncbi:MAG TPA: helix-turn-helix domain-containing protein, partial [Pseudobdellovibrionaceae bacterium]|nr:helix-turn-helix domain-containing protein [Pseudobdellovibrionaceae bacterium]